MNDLARALRFLVIVYGGIVAFCALLAFIYWLEHGSFR